jgi:hypothetical protein
MIRAIEHWLTALICDLAYGVFGGMVDLSVWRDELEGRRAEIAELEERVNPAPRRFEAYTDCPKCGRMDHHWLRAPLPKPVEGPVCVLPDGAEIHRWDGMSGPDESMFEVIRICTGCGHEWGML